MANILKIRSHLELVAKERKYYRDIVKESKKTFADKEPCEPNSSSLKTSVHYSFDMAQQVHIPSNPLQPGPIYFLVPFKIGIFGVMCETVNKQVNYLIPESVSTTKGSNLIVSLFHHQLENYSFGEETMFIHADNCVGQNKNNIVLAYLAWRISTNKNKMIVLSFLPVGHTKFSCDWAFGLLKKKFRITHVSSVQEFAECIDNSTPTSKVNSAVAVGNEKGDVFVNVYNWLQFFKDSKANKVKHITSYNHFEFCEEFKGKVHGKTDIDGNEFVHRIFPDESAPVGFPVVVIPTGMTRERKEYLYKHIRPYCKEDLKDVVCPSIKTLEGETVHEEDEEAIPALEPPAKKTKRSKRRLTSS